jgi:methylated-DNA-protein-cysteine methyltransferase-like protein
MTQDSFSKQVVNIALSIPKGKATTYGCIAHAAGGGAIASQSITSILAKATTNSVRNIPYHRIVYSDGRVWMDPMHRRKRLALYKKEGVNLDKTDRIINFKDILI